MPSTASWRYFLLHCLAELLPKKGIQLSISKMLDELSKIKEVVLFYRGPGSQTQLLAIAAVRIRIIQERTPV